MKDWIKERLQILRSSNVIPFPFSAERVERLRKAKADEKEQLLNKGWQYKAKAKEIEAKDHEQIKKLPEDTS
jgi:hypothetical protein